MCFNFCSNVNKVQLTDFIYACVITTATFICVTYIHCVTAYSKLTELLAIFTNRTF